MTVICKKEKKRLLLQKLRFMFSLPPYFRYPLASRLPNLSGLFGLCCLALSLTSLEAQAPNNYFDGPYIDQLGDSLRIRWIEAGVPKDSMLLAATAERFERPGLPLVQLNDLSYQAETDWQFAEVPKFIALSDLHGQFDIFRRLLLAHGVIDERQNWAFGENHLIITGDHFSRGDEVMAILWLLFQLDQQAAAAGGKLHILLGNHELMTLNNDLRYLHRKYSYTAGGLKSMYPALFGSTSVLGNWLRGKQVVVAVNDILFLHAGLSERMMQSGMELEEINRYFRQTILPSSGIELAEDPLTDLLLGGEGPLWYRGYIDSTFSKDSLERVLDFYNVNHIVVGHSSMPEIISKFKNRLFLIDCSIKLGESGELLIWEDDNFFRGKMDGSTEAFTKVPKVKRISLFERISQQHEQGKTLKINLQCDTRKLITRSMLEEYQPTTFHLMADGQTDLSIHSRVRARGNMRKQVCPLPPLKFDFNKKELKALGLSSADKLKLVIPCRSGKRDQEKLLQEYFLYGLFALIEPAHIKAIPIDIAISDQKGKAKYDFRGFLVEDELAYARRTKAHPIGKRGVINSNALDRESFLRMYFFQYMIGNTDWSIPHRHNIMLVRSDGQERCSALPYDFDYSGFVGQGYAVPSDNLPIKSVRDRHFMPYPISDQEFEETVAFFSSQQQKIMNYCDQATYLQPKTIAASKEYLLEFFKALEKPDRLRRSMTVR